MLLSEINFELLKSKTKTEFPYELQRLELVEKELTQELLDNIEELVNNGCTQQLHLMSECFQRNFQKLRDLNFVDNGHEFDVKFITINDNYLNKWLFTELKNNRCDYLLNILNDDNVIKKIFEIDEDHWDKGDTYSCDKYMYCSFFYPKEHLGEFEDVLNKYCLIRPLFPRHKDDYDYIENRFCLTPLAEHLIAMVQQNYLKSKGCENLNLRNEFDKLIETIADKCDCIVKRANTRQLCIHFINKDGLIVYKWFPGNVF
jgi:hypothetical protein